MRKLSVILTLSATLLISCRTNDPDIYAGLKESQIDSLVRANRNVDYLLVLSERFASEENILGQIIVCRELGRVYRNSSSFSEANQVHKKGLELAVEYGDTIHIVQALNNLGTNYRRMGVLDEASDYHYKALSYAEVYSGRDSKVGLKNLVVTLNGIGNVQLSLGNDEVAFNVFRRALKGESRLGSALGQAINYANIGALFEADGKIDSARWYYTRSMVKNQEAESDLGIALCHNHFGRLAERESDLDLALSEYNKAYDLLVCSKDVWHWLESCLSLARVNIQKGSLSLAQTYLNKAETSSRKIGSLDHLAEVYRLQYLLYEKQGRYPDALKALTLSHDYRDSISVEKNLTHLQNVRVRYEREKKQAEIEQIQNNHNQERRRKNLVIGFVAVALLLSVIAIASLIYILRLRSRNQRIMKEMERTRTNFFTNITHEFRTPLTVILSAANDISVRNKADKVLQRDVEDIVRHGKGLLELVNQILDISKITSAIGNAPQWKHGDIVGLLTTICEGCQRHTDRKGIKFGYSFDSDVIEMDYIPKYLVRIVQNLLSNAIKYSYTGSEVLLSVKTTNDCVSIYVCDTGKGMTKEQKEKIFQPFYQAEDNTDNIGSGIGLSLVKLTVEAMNGHVEVHSYPSEGSVFIVTLPLSASGNINVTSEQDEYDIEFVASDGALTLEDEDDGQADTPRILIVEDTPEVARWQMRQLNPQYNFYFAADGAEGFEKAKEIVPDLIITDVMMPVMDGFELCEKVRSNDILCHIPIIMVTAKATQEDKLKGLQLGVDAYLEKPFNPTELSVRVEKLLEQREMLRRKFSENSSIEENKSISISIPDRAFLDKLSSAIHDMIESGNMDYDQLASDFCVGKTQLNRKIKAITGFTTTDYIHQVRISMAKQLLIKTNLPIGDIASRIGIDDVSYFSLLFRKITGKTPSSYRNR